jgi:uncharacterized protein (DUF302 family)
MEDIVTKTMFALGAGFLALAGLALAPPMLAQDRPGGGTSMKEEACGKEELPGKSYDEVRNKLREDLKREGLIIVSEVDWARLEGAAGGAALPKSGEKTEGAGGPGGAGLQAYTFLFVSRDYVNHVREKPEKALWVPGHIALYEKEGKLNVSWFKPTVMMEHAKREATPEKAREIEEHMEKAKAFEAKIEKVIEEVKGGR